MMWPFGKSLHTRATEAMTRVESRIDSLVKCEQQARTELAKAYADISAKASEIETLKGKVRVQTEADLYLASAKIMRDILETGKAKEVDVSRQQALQYQLRGLSAQSAIYGANYTTNPLSALGNILG